MCSGVMSMGAQCAAASVVVVDHGACNTYHALIWACAEAHVMRRSVCIRTWGIAEGVHGGVTSGDAGGGTRACMHMWAPLVASGGGCMHCSACGAVEALLVEQEGVVLASVSRCRQRACDTTHHTQHRPHQ